MSKLTFTRRRALEGLGILIAGSPLVQGQGQTGAAPVRLAPFNELAFLPEFEEQAKLKLSKTAFAAIAGSEREAFERMTFKPHYCIDTVSLDMSTELFGEKLFTPILVGATPRQKRFHPDGELATARGASAGKAVLVVSSDSSVPLEQVAGESKTTLWYEVSPGADIESVRARMQQAVKAGYKAIVIAVGPGVGPTLPPPDWTVIDQLRKGISVPVLVKGILTPADAKAAVQQGVQGIVVSCNRVPAPSGLPAAIEVLPSIVDAVGGKLPVLVDGSFRFGTDIEKGLALGAKAVLVGRPAMWGLAPYGAEGVQAVVEMLQTELARIMTMCGSPNLAANHRDLVKIHPRRVAKKPAPAPAKS